MDDATSQVSGAVVRWWQAWQDKDSATIEALARPDYVEYAGTGPKRLQSRDSLMRVADRFFSSSTIEAWAIDEVVIRWTADSALCSYHWRERGIRDGQAFQLEGIASDFLVRADGEWLYQAHHVSLFVAEPGRVR